MHLLEQPSLVDPTGSAMAFAERRAPSPPENRRSRQSIPQHNFSDWKIITEGSDLDTHQGHEWEGHEFTRARKVHHGWALAPEVLTTLLHHAPHSPKGIHNETSSN